MGLLRSLTGPKAKRGVSRRRWLLVIAAGLVAVWATGLAIFAQNLPRQEDTLGEPNEAIVVLTGGTARVSTGLALLSAQKGEELFVSGVHESTELGEILRQGRTETTGETLSCCITLDREARNTAGNARETAAWLGRNNIGSIRLVTSAYHMPRALLEFRMAAPDVEIVAHPVEASHVHLESWWQWPGTSRLLVTEYNKYLVTLGRYVLDRLGWAGAAALPS